MLKKIVILFMALSAFPLWMKAEFPIDIKYAGDVNMAYGSSSKVSGRNTYAQRVSVGTIQGFSLNQYLQFGVGVDFNMYTHYYKDKEPFKSANLSGFRLGMNEFVDIRGGYAFNDNWKIFLDLGLGITHGVLHMGDKVNFFCQFAPGFGCYES